MIDLASVITTGGVILFYKTLCQIKEDVLSKVVEAIVLQKPILKVASMKVEWIIINELGLIFIVAYQELFYIPYIDVLLTILRDQYLKVHSNLHKQNGIYKTIPAFDTEFEQVLNMWQLYCEKKNTKTQAAKQQIQQPQEIKEEPKSPQPERTLTKSEILKLKTQQQKAKSPPSGAKSPESVKSPVIMNNKITSKQIESLNYASKSQTQSISVNKYQSNDKEDELLKQFLDSDDSVFGSDDEVTKPGLFSKLTNGLKNLTGNKELTKEDLEPVLDQFKHALMLKNVAEEIAQKLCDSIRVKLLSTKTKAFTTISKTVRECLKQTLIKILTPNRNIDIIAEALRSREKQKPYVIVFIGVNGVGKSTNLAKVAYLYKSQGFSVMIAACDNFRAGAVEQVKTHGECLGVPVYDRGYKDEPPEIAFQAIREATLKKIDVVLVDTAGRMQHNEPLMRALSRIVTMNNPDLVVFIGEALVGNDGVDQLQNFNKALIVNSPKDNVREIDAIIVSKFDTVDEKVGAALSLTSATGKPILFVGVGQKYTHLKKLNVNTVVAALLQ